MRNFIEVRVADGMNTLINVNHIVSCWAANTSQTWICLVSRKDDGANEKVLIAEFYDLVRRKIQSATIVESN